MKYFCVWDLFTKHNRLSPKTLNDWNQRFERFSGKNVTKKWFEKGRIWVSFHSNLSSSFWPNLQLRSFATIKLNKYISLIVQNVFFSLELVNVVLEKIVKFCQCTLRKAFFSKKNPQFSSWNFKNSIFRKKFKFSSLYLINSFLAKKKP